MKSDDKIRIIVADDHRILREGLIALLEKHETFIVLAEAENGRQAVKLAENLKPDVLIMDVNMPDLNGIEATRRIVSNHSEIKVVALSIYSDRRFVIGMLKAGASGYLLKDCAFNELAMAVRTVASDKTYLSPGISGAVREYISEFSEEHRLSDVLTGREKEILQLISEGHSAKDIAFSLHVSVKTVETHRQKIMKKLNITSVADLTKFALREGITTL